MISGGKIARSKDAREGRFIDELIVEKEIKHCIQLVILFGLLFSSCVSCGSDRATEGD